MKVEMIEKTDQQKKPYNAVSKFRLTVLQINFNSTNCQSYNT